VGILAYADDLVLLETTVSVMRELLNSKCLVALPKNCRNTFKKVNDCIVLIDLVQSCSHIGHVITSDSDDGEDITIRKHSFIGHVVANIENGRKSGFLSYYMRSIGL